MGASPCERLTMSIKNLWILTALSLGMFAVAAGTAATATAEDDGGCFYGGAEGTICNVVYKCTLGGCGTQTFVDSPPCRPGGTGPTC